MHGLRAGRLREVVSIKSASSVQDGYGQAIKTWSTSATTRAAVRQLTETEIETGGKYEGRTVYEFTIRNQTVSKENRLYWNGSDYEILGEPKNISERDRILKIRAVRYE